jgi:hypothetical protein
LVLVPVNIFIDDGAGPNPGLALTHNAFWAEPLGNGKLRFYFMTESDNQAADLLMLQGTPLSAILQRSLGERVQAHADIRLLESRSS